MTESISFLDGKVTLHCGDCRDVLASMPDESVDSVVCDPPYALTQASRGGSVRTNNPETPFGRTKLQDKGFMGKAWDTGEVAFDPEFWAQVLRVLKPGGHLLAFSGTRTYHRMVCAIEDAGFEIRDQIGWAYGSGFPKSHDVEKAITKRADPSKVRDIKLWLAEKFSASGKSKSQINRECGFTASDYLKTEPGNDAGGRATWHLLLPYGEKWAKLKAVVGFGDEYDAEIERFGVVAGQRIALKENREIYGKYSGVVTDYDSTDAAREWSGWGTALKPAWEPIVMARKPLIGTVAENVLTHGTGALNIEGCRIEAAGRPARELDAKATDSNVYTGRTGEGGLGKGLDGGSKAVGTTDQGRWPANIIHDGSDEVVECFPSEAGAAAPVYKRNGDKLRNTYGAFGGNIDEQGSTFQGDSGSAARFFYTAKADSEDRLGSKHPTVKPIDLMQYLVRLVTPKGGVVLDPFAGTGTTGEAAWREGMKAILIEREAEYQADIAQRMDLATKPTKRAAVAKTKNNLDQPEDLPLFGGAT